jgi:predicted nucleic acid-binding protein
VSRIYWDTMLFVYWIEDHPDHAGRVQAIFEKMEERGDSLCTSAFTLGELLAGPLKTGAADIAERIRGFLRSPAVQLMPFTEATAERYATIRALHRVSPADAIHLASAAQEGVDLLLTNDQRLRGLTIPGIHFIAGMNVDLF